MGSRQIRLTAYFDTGKPLECIWEEEIDSLNDWIVYIRNPEHMRVPLDWKKNHGWKFGELNSHSMSVPNKRRSELHDYVNKYVMYVDYGPFVIDWAYPINRVDHGRLALQMEASHACIEGRPIRKFIGSGCRSI